MENEKKVPVSARVSEAKVNELDQIAKENEMTRADVIEAKLNEDISGAIVFPAKTIHEENYLEFICENKLRDEYNLKDGDIVSLEF